MNKINGYTEEEAKNLVEFIKEGKRKGKTLFGFYFKFISKSSADASSDKLRRRKKRIHCRGHSRRSAEKRNQKWIISVSNTIGESHIGIDTPQTFFFFKIFRRFGNIVFPH